MKQWLKQTEAPEGPPKRRSSSHSREFRQVISILTNSYPSGHFLAYCLVTKESSHGIFLNERLLAIDTLTKQLKYYSHIPKLPLSHPHQLPAPKESIKLRPGVEFNVEKVRIGHVLIQWQQNRQKHSWKIIMGSNHICKQFYDLFSQVMKLNNEEIESRQLEIPKEYKIIKKETSEQPKELQQTTPQREEKTNENIDDFSMTNNKPSSNSSPLASIPNNSAKFENSSSEYNLNIALQDSRRAYDQQKKLAAKHFKALQIPQISTDRSPSQKPNLMMFDWILAKNEPERAQIYSRFVQKCMRKIQNIMDSFMASHLMHQQLQGMQVIRDFELQIYYVALIDSTEEESVETLSYRIEVEQEMLEEWQCLNYLSSVKSFKNITVVVPMVCLLTFKSFKFYCKSNQQQYPHKQKIDPNNYAEQFLALEKATHLNLRNCKEEVYLVDNISQIIFYFNRISCRPKVAKTLPISLRYIDTYVTDGVISSQKDIEAISTHISNKLIKKIKQNLGIKSFATSCELMDYLEKYGLSYHYLPFLLEQSSLSYDYNSRLIASEIVASAMQWQIRRRMHVQLFRRRQFGFAINQIRIALNLLLQEDLYFLKIIENIVKSQFNFAFASIVPLKDVIERESMIISLLNRLGFDCKNPYVDSQNMKQLWSQKYISDYIELSPYIDSQLLEFKSFSEGYKILKDQLIGQPNYDMNSIVALQTVIGVLKVQKNTNGLYSVSHIYAILPVQVKMKVNYYLSHFLAPPFEQISHNSLQAHVYMDSTFCHYYCHTLQYLTTLNKIRWLVRMRYYQQAEELIARQIEKAIIWNQYRYLIQIHSFYSKLKLKQGFIKLALEYSLKALQYSLIHYEKETTVAMQLQIAENAFEAGNLHFFSENYTKAIDLYSTVQEIVSKINTSGEQINLNSEFMELFVNKCSVLLLFGQYNQCLDQCLSSLKACQKFQKTDSFNAINQFKIYEVLFRCYQIKNMRRELVELANICSQKYVEDKIYINQGPHLHILAEVIKIQWISIIKLVQLPALALAEDQKVPQKLKTIYLKKVRQQLKKMREQIGQTHRHSQAEIQAYLAGRIRKHPYSRQDCRLQQEIVLCLSEISLKQRKYCSRIHLDEQLLTNQWVLLEGLAVLAGYDFLVGAIDDSLRIYDYQY